MKTPVRYCSRILCYFVLTALILTVARADQAGQPKSSATIDVDLSEVPRRLVHAKLVIPANPGPLTLCYPKWIPGEHGPNGPIADLSGLTIRANGQTLPWKRDEIDLHSFHCEVPAGAKSVEVSLDYLMPSATFGYTAGSSASPHLAILNWHLVLLYPKGSSVRDLEYTASVSLPTGWKLGTALPVANTSVAKTAFAPVTLEMLMDSPVLCGEYLREVPLGQADGRSHFMVVAGDTPASIEVNASQKAKLERLIAEAGVLYGARHYNSYRFLVSLSDLIRPTGLEHHQSSDNRVPERMFQDPELIADTWLGYLLSHEYTHSWNGKYRRPAGLVTRDFQEPQRPQLLWVYEGLTEYLGVVLAARSGLWTPERTRDHLAFIAEALENQRGRSWRPLEDTTTSAPFLYAARADWSSRRRGVDFYDEGTLLWLEVDVLIRQLTQGKKSIDDFCHRFHGGESGPPIVRTYTFDDVVADLNAVAPYDWKTHLQRRVATVAEHAPVEGIRQGGWKFTYADTPSPYHRGQERMDRSVILSSSIGLVLAEDGGVTDVIPGKPADKVGVGPSMKLIAVNGRNYTAEGLHDAIAATKTPGGKLELLLKNGDFYKTYTLDYHDGEKYPRLERDAGKPDVLAEIFKPRTATGAK